MSLGSGKQKALLGAGLRSAGRVGARRNWPRDMAGCFAQNGLGAGQGGRVAGLGMLPRLWGLPSHLPGCHPGRCP